MKSIIAALLLTTINSFCQQPASPATVSANSVEITETTPKTPSDLAIGTKLTVSIHYNNFGQNPVRIFARPFTGGKSTPGFRAHGSHEYATGSGDVDGWFFFDRPVVVDEVVVTMFDIKTREIIVTTKLPVKFTWK